MEEVRFYDEVASERELGSSREILIFWGDFLGHMEKYGKSRLNKVEV